MVQQAFSQILGGLEVIAQSAETAEQRIRVLGLYRLAAETARQYGQGDLAGQLKQEGQKLVPKVFHGPPNQTDSPAHKALFKYFIQGSDLAQVYPQLLKPIVPPTAKPPAYSSGLEMAINDGDQSEKGFPSVTTGPVKWGYLRELVVRNNGGDVALVNADMAYLGNKKNMRRLPEGTLRQEQGGRNQWMYRSDMSEAIKSLLQNQRRHSLRERTSPPGHPPPPAEPEIKEYDPFKIFEANYFGVGDRIITPAGTSGKVTEVGTDNAGRISITVLKDNGTPTHLSVRTK